MNLGQGLLWWRSAPVPRVAKRVTPDWVNGGAEPEAPTQDEPAKGCGWFDSSHELHSGLQVTEHADPDAVVNELPLGWWLDWQTAGKTAGHPAARRAS